MHRHYPALRPPVKSHELGKYRIIFGNDLPRVTDPGLGKEGAADLFQKNPGTYWLFLRRAADLHHESVGS